MKVIRGRRKVRSVRRFAVSAVVVAGLVALAVPAVAQQRGGDSNASSNGSSNGVVATPDPVPAQYIVTLRTPPAASGAAAASLSTRHGGHVVRTYTKALAGYTAQMTPAEATELSQDPAVAAVEQDGYVSIAATQTPAPSWGLDRIDQRNLPLDNAYSPSNAGAGAGAGVTAYIIDTGIRATNTDFGGRASVGYDAVGDGQNGVDCNGHGTHVAGTVGGTKYGVAKSVLLVAVRVLDCGGSGTWSGVIAGIDWVTAHHAPDAVANMSLGGGAVSAVDTALANSVAAGVTYAVAAGNSNADACTSSPARAPSAITVGATTSTDARASYSNFGTCVDLFAPGSGITSDWNTSDTATNTISGTSMATPHVVGSAALYLGEHPGASPATVTAALLGAATPSKVTAAGAGSPNLLDFVGTSVPPVTTTTSTTTTTSATTTTTTTTTTLAKEVPSAPVLKGASAKWAAKLTWTAPANGGSAITGYRLSRATAVGGPYTQIASPAATATSYSDNNLKASTTYWYRVTAVNAVGTGPVSNTVAVIAGR
jgi:subtilisin family serine protease